MKLKIADLRFNIKQDNSIYFLIYPVGMIPSSRPCGLMDKASDFGSEDCRGIKQEPSIAQLVERWTVVGMSYTKTSIGRWFKSGSKEFFFV
ncbi:hypothetical protein CAJAP_09989 [Camponotus japonicus]